VPEKLELNLRLTDLAELIRDTIAKLGIKRNTEEDKNFHNLTRVRLNCDFQPVPKIMIDPEYIEKVILNLITNAIEAISEEGDVTLRLYSQDGFIHLEVRDTGCGMSREFINHQLFKPFQTTKQKGIGIGLYQCKIIVSAHGGQIETDSTEGVGSTFTLKLKQIANGKT
jgi:signal transduction histidine kinase